MSFRIVPTIVASAIALSACSATNQSIGTEDPFLGEAVKFNAAIQTINPDPVYPEDSARPGDMGDRGAEAVERYRTDRVNSRHQREARQNSAISTTGGQQQSGGPQ